MIVKRENEKELKEKEFMTSHFFFLNFMSGFRRKQQRVTRYSSCKAAQ